MTVKARVSGVSTWHASPSTMYTHSTAAEAECQRNKKQTGVLVLRGVEGVEPACTAPWRPPPAARTPPATAYPRSARSSSAPLAGRTGKGSGRNRKQGTHTHTTHSQHWARGIWSALVGTGHAAQRHRTLPITGLTSRTKSKQHEKQHEPASYI
eukprot:1196124-Prorocentrum_minimum.AAC.6